MAETKEMLLRQRENSSNLEDRIQMIDRTPFKGLKIDDASVLDTIEGREICGRCYKSRKFFCYTCYTPVIDDKYFPRVKLPIKIDIIKHAREIDGKTTAVHAAVLAPEDVKIYTYPDFPDLSKEEETILIFPSTVSGSVDSLFTREIIKNGRKSMERLRNQFPVRRAIFIDSTWHQTKSIYKDPRLRELRTVILRSRISQFWRHQKKSPRWYLATIEAIHQFLVELHMCAFGVEEEYVQEIMDNQSLTNMMHHSIKHEIEKEHDSSITSQKYNGQYDNLLYLFKYMYDKIHSMYDHDKLWAYKRPLI